MLTELLEDAAVKDVSLQFAFVWPVMFSLEVEDLSPSERSIIWEKKTVEMIALFRNIGYRRNGNSDWFRYAFDPQYRPRQLSIQDNYMTPDQSRTELDKIDAEFEESWTIRQPGFMSIGILSFFCGFSDADVINLLRLHGIYNPSTKDDLTARHECSCSKCLGGFISLRTRYESVTVAQIRAICFLKHMRCKESTGVRQTTWCPYSSTYRIHVDKSWWLISLFPRVPFLSHGTTIKRDSRTGSWWPKMVHRIADYLNRNEVLTPSNVYRTHIDNSEWPPCTKNYLERGATI